MNILRNLLIMAVLAAAASVSQAGTPPVESPAGYCLYVECNYILGTGCPGNGASLCSECSWRWFSSSVCQLPAL